MGAIHAVVGGRLPVLIYLVKRCKADPREQDDKLLCMAADYGQLAVVRYLIEECGADPNAQKGSPLGEAAHHGRLAVARYLVEKAKADPRIGGDQPLGWAAYGGELALVRYFIEEHGADPRANDDWPLQSAALWGHAEVADYLAGCIFRPEAWRDRDLSAIAPEVLRLQQAIRDSATDDGPHSEIEDIVQRRGLETLERLRAERAAERPLELKPMAPPKVL